MECWDTKRGEWFSYYQAKCELGQDWACDDIAEYAKQKRHEEIDQGDMDRIQGFFVENYEGIETEIDQFSDSL